MGGCIVCDYQINKKYISLIEYLKKKIIEHGSWKINTKILGD